MGLCDVFRCNVSKLVNVHVQRHIKSLNCGTTPSVIWCLCRGKFIALSHDGDVDLGRMIESLINDAIPFCQTKQSSNLLFAGVSVQIELQPNLLTSDWHILVDAKSAANSEIALSADRRVA